MTLTAISLPWTARHAIQKAYKAGYHNTARMIGYLAVPQGGQYLQHLRFTCELTFKGKKQVVRYSYARREPYDIPAYQESLDEFFHMPEEVKEATDVAIGDILNHLRNDAELHFQYSVFSISFDTNHEIIKEEYPKIHLQAVILELINFFENENCQNLADLVLRLEAVDEKVLLIGFLAEPSARVKALPLNDPYLTGIYQSALSAAVIFGDIDSGIRPVESLLLLRESFGQFSKDHQRQFNEAAAVMLWYLEHPKIPRPSYLSTGRILYITEK